VFSAVSPIANSSFEDELAKDMGRFYDDPLGYVMYAFEWGKGELEGCDGPDEWQTEQLRAIGRAVRNDPENYTIRDVTSSGHGIGKSAEVAWLILWAMSTRPHLSGVVTANTTAQLNTKTWRELALWHERAINKHWFKWTATKFHHVEHWKTWAVSAIPNTEHNSEAFAGLHAKHVLMIYDEASGIPDKIWEVSEGAMTTPRAMWFAFGNPTKNVGRFVNCFTSDAKRWKTRQIDSRTCKMTNKKEIAEWVEAYGEDSDFVRVRVRGVFPRTGNMQFMPTDTVDRAMLVDMAAEVHILMPVVIACDVARYGDDKTVICVRQGRKVLEMRKFRDLDTMQVAVQVALAVKQYKEQLAATFVDEVGIGAGVVDRLRMLNFEVVGVNAGATPRDKETYYNKRAEMWGDLRAWLASGASIPADPELRKALIGCEFGFDDKERIRLERKADMKRRGLDSPDEGDALAYTFAEELGDISIQAFEPNSESFEPG
jgi:hypothetical protein